MSQHGLLKAQENREQHGEQLDEQPVLTVYEPWLINEIKNGQKQRTFYYSLDFPFFGDYLKPSMQPIIQKKKLMGKNFVQDPEIQFNNILVLSDGLFQNHISQGQNSNAIKRLKMRAIRDSQQQFFQENGQFILENQFFQEQMSRLVNISFEQNKAIQIFQKNAILSQRNNQKKNVPFQLQIDVGSIWFTRHPLHNQQQNKFQDIRSDMKLLAQYSSYPTIPQLHQQLDHLEQYKDSLTDGNAPLYQIQQVQDKIQKKKIQYEHQVAKIERLMKKILDGWNQIRQIRIKTGMQTVPWRLFVKQYVVDGRSSYDFGLRSFQPSQKVQARTEAQANKQQNRRKQIKAERYCVRVYVNGNQIGRSQKKYLQWPSFKVEFNEKFNIVVYSVPSSIQIEVIKIGLINSVIDRVSLVVPGINAKTISSSQKRYATSIFANKSYFFRQGNQEFGSPSGSVIYRVQWKGSGSRMPPLSSSVKSKQQQITAATQQDIQYNELFDNLDPRLPPKSKHDVIQPNTMLRIQNNLLPFATIQSTRNLLLKWKSIINELQKMDIPLLEDSVRRRQDLIKIIHRQKMKQIQTLDQNQLHYYNPLQGFFSRQDENVLRQIRKILFKIQNMKGTGNAQGSNLRQKITQQIIKQYVFVDQQSPFMLFIKSLFTQKRKLGPQQHFQVQARTSIQMAEINFHIRAASNVLIRQSGFKSIRHFQQQENKLRQMNQMLSLYANQAFNIFGQQQNQAFNFFGQQQQPNFQNQNMWIAGLNMGSMLPPIVQQQTQVNYNDKRSLERVQTCMQLKFKNISRRTQCFQGPHPQWNESLVFNYNLKTQNMNLQKLALQNQKTINIYMFDMPQISKPTLATDQAKIKKSRYYLGKIEIPFSTLVTIPALTGIFKLDRPIITFGYGIKKAGLYDPQEDQEEANKTLQPDIHTYINLDMFTQPLFDSIAAFNSDKKFVTGAPGQSTLLLQRASDWLQQLNSKRYVRLWLNNIDGRSVFICRYLSDKICPPQELGTQNLIQRCARFVSLIPKKFECRLLNNTDEFHLTNKQFLNVKMGQDHGILLCNYFNYINKTRGESIQSYLLLGKSFPYGKTIFVLRRDLTTGNCEIWDPYKGECYYMPAKQYASFCCCFQYEISSQVMEPSTDICPLFEVTEIVSSNNVYINIQQSLKPADISFEIENSKLWKPFFTQRTLAEFFPGKIIQTVQEEINPQFYPHKQNPEGNLEVELQEFIRDKLQTTRRKNFNPYTVRINNAISNLVRNKLLLFCQTFKSDYRQSGRRSTLYPMQPQRQSRQLDPYHRAVQELQREKNLIKNQVDSQKLLYGFPINTTYTTKQELWEKVAETQVHSFEKQDIQFVLCVRCFQIVCHVVSVWVFIGIIQ